MQWDDLRFLANLARTGSMTRAAIDLEVDRTTVMRRIAALEKSVGYHLFHKHAGTWQPLPEALPLLDAAGAIEGLVSDARRKMTFSADQLEGSLAFTTTDSLYLSGVSEMTGQFLARYPQITLSLAITTRRLSIDGMESEVMLRPSDNPPDHLIGRRLCQLGFGIYGSESYLLRNDSSTVGEHEWLGVDGTLEQSVPGKWLASNVPVERYRIRADTFIALAAACQSGAGLALLPCSYAASQAGLLRVRRLEKNALSTGLWLLTHPDFVDLPRVRAFMDYMREQVTLVRSRFEG